VKRKYYEHRTQDPNDEPAAVLLKRIKAEKTAQAGARKLVRKRKPRRKEATTKDFSVVRREGTREVKRSLQHYNLDAIIFVGYRVSIAVAPPDSASGSPIENLIRYRHATG